MSSLKNFFVAFSMILKSPQLRAWYLRTMLRTFAVAILIFVLLLFGGFYFFWSMVGHWWGGLGSIIYVILLLYVSGSVTSLIASAVVQTVGGEKALLRALSEPNRREVENPSFALVFEHRKQEYFGITLSLLASVLVFPLFSVSAIFASRIIRGGVGLGARKSQNRRSHSFTKQRAHNDYWQ